MNFISEVLHLARFSRSGIRENSEIVVMSSSGMLSIMLHLSNDSLLSGGEAAAIALRQRTNNVLLVP